MIERRDTRLLLSPSDLEPSNEQLRIVSVFNPGVAEVDGKPMLLARIAEAPVESPDAYFSSPRADDGRIVIDRFPEADVEGMDMRVFRVRRTGCMRLTFISHLRVVPLTRTGLAVDRDALAKAPRIMPAGRCEIYGVEDPRITKIGDQWWIPYVGVSCHGVSTMLASTTDFKTFQRHGIIFNTMNKDVVLFPEKVGGRYAAMHRPMGEFNPPEMWLAYSDDLLHWGGHQPMPLGGEPWMAGKVGAGCPPMLTDRGWLAIYHGNDKQPGEDRIGTYFGGALLIDRDEPDKILARSTEPIIRPEADFEKHGFVPDVVFPTGMIDRGDRYLVYYGAADEHIGAVVWDKADVMASLDG